MKNITNYELLNALVDTTNIMNSWITNCRTCEECEKCALFPCVAIKQTDKNKVIINSWIMNCRKCEECKRCAVFPCASVKQTNNKIYMEDSNKNFCPHCGQELIKSTTDGYDFQCMNCDEDFVSFEVISKKI